MREHTTLRVEFNVDGTWYGKRMDLDSPDLRLQVPPPVNHSSQAAALAAVSRENLGP